MRINLKGDIVKQIFDLASPMPVMLLAALMTIIAGVTAVRRIDHRYPSIYATAVFAVWSSTWVVTAVTVLLIV